jgi:RNA polymerase sigma-70 factor (ECF subfamily)
MPAEPPPRRDCEAARHGAAPQGEARQKETFRALVEPNLDALLSAAKHELEYRQAVGDLTLDDLTAEELVGETLARAWRDRHRRPLLLGLRPWLLGLLFRVADSLARQEARRREAAAVSLEAPIPPEPPYDDESFWEWYQPEATARWKDVIPAAAAAPEQVVAALEREEGRALSRTARRLLLLTDVHRLSVAEAAGALHVPVAEAARLLAETRRTLRSRKERD